MLRGLKPMSIDDIKDGQRINCNGVNGTVIGKRNTRNRRLVFVKMDNGFTLKLNAQTLLGDTSQSSVREYAAATSAAR